MSEKLQKVLARAGLGSRRLMEEWIQNNRVSINGKFAHIGDRVEPTDIIRVDGHALSQHQTEQSTTRVIIYHKPEGQMCTRNDPEGRATVFEHLPLVRNGRWISIGRLDFNTSGLLLFTTNGELANRLMHPSQEIEREYAVRVLGEIDQSLIARLKKGIMLDDGLARFDEIIDAGGTGANHWYHVILREGRNREVRKLWESQGIKVSRLIRVRYGDITLPRTLRLGRWVELDNEQISEIAANVNLTIDEDKKVTPRGIKAISDGSNEREHRLGKIKRNTQEKQAGQINKSARENISRPIKKRSIQERKAFQARNAERNSKVEDFSKPASGRPIKFTRSAKSTITGVSSRNAKLIKHTAAEAADKRKAKPTKPSKYSNSDSSQMAKKTARSKTERPLQREHEKASRHSKLQRNSSFKSLNKKAAKSRFSK